MMDHHEGRALELFRQAVERNPQNADAYIGIAEISANGGYFHAAIDANERYLNLLPHGPYASMAQRQIDSLRQRVGRPAPSDAP